MKKVILQILQLCIFVTIVTLVFVAFVKYDESSDLSKGIIVPIIFVAIFALLFLLQLLFTAKNKPAWAMLLMVARYIIMCVGIPFIFAASIMGIAFCLLLPIVGPAIALSVMASRWLIFLIVLLLHIGLVAECIIAGITLSARKKVAAEQV